MSEVNIQDVGDFRDESQPIAEEIPDGKSIKLENIKPVAHGAYADVYRGEYQPAGGLVKYDVAIKILRLTGMNTVEEHNNAMARAAKHLSREVRVWQKLAHPRIVPLLGYMRNFENEDFPETDRPCLVSPYRQKGNLLLYIRGNPNVDKVLLLRQAAEALNFMHTLKPTPIAHLDIKPDNILIDDNGEAQLCDFGISRVLDDLPSGFTTSTGGGYLPFLSPELLSDNTKSTAADVYAFGCVVLQALSGKVPWNHVARGRMTILVSTGKTLASDDEKPKYPIDAPQAAQDAIWGLLVKCWALDPEERVKMAEVILQLDEIRRLMHVA